MKKAIPKKSDNIADWYTRLIIASDLADYGPVKGTMIFKPYGYRIWELVQAAMDPLIKARGVDNAYFPLFIPMSLIEREKQHVKGFAPELAVVTHGGGVKLQEPLAIRPTSETIMYEAYARWIQSWRDLPVMMNQWNNIVRWEKRTYLFLRTSEFLWQEGHTAHATHEEAMELQRWAMQLYESVFKDYFAIFGYVGWKSQNERFAGADSSLTYEALMPSGKALQSATAHDLGQNFAKSFDISFVDKGGKAQHVWQTSWGLSTRSIGGLILMHGDDNGLRLPPRLAPYQVVILPVTQDKKQLALSQKLAAELKKIGIRATVDATDDETIGYRINKWELKGAPLRAEVGQREVNGHEITLVRRDNGEKSTLKISSLDKIADVLDRIQDNMLRESRDFTKAHTHDVRSYDEFKDVMSGGKGFIRTFWHDNPSDEDKIKLETKATSRCRPLEQPASTGKCFYTSRAKAEQWLFAQSY